MTTALAVLLAAANGWIIRGYTDAILRNRRTR
jgi:hypothetical protein